MCVVPPHTGRPPLDRFGPVGLPSMHTSLCAMVLSTCRLIVWSRCLFGVNVHMLSRILTSGVCVRILLSNHETENESSERARLTTHDSIQPSPGEIEFYARLPQTQMGEIHERVPRSGCLSSWVGHGRDGVASQHRSQLGRQCHGGRFSVMCCSA